MPIRLWPKDYAKKAKKLADDRMYDLKMNDTDAEDVDIWDFVTLADCQSIVLTGKNWSTIFEELLVRPEEVRIAGGKEAKTQWILRMSAIKNKLAKDVFFLGQPSEPATKADIQVGKDLQDTLQANRERCVGMAANMIGVKKNIIIVNMGFIDVVMFNPAIVSKRNMYETEEGCLSLDGVRKTNRYQEIEVEYYDFNWKKQHQKLSGWTAQICQHEIDHLSGKII